jgi:hypothetical protein
MTTRSWWHPYTPRVRQMQEALRHVPSGVWVDASNGPGIMLTDRDKVQLWSMPGDRSHYTAPWIFADVGQWTFPFKDVDQQKQRVEQLKQRGYKVVYDKNGWVVLHNPDGPQELA